MHQLVPKKKSVLVYNIIHSHVGVDINIIKLCPIGALLSYADLLMRCTMDIVSAALGVYIYERIK
jgi:hypothetical protein